MGKTVLITGANGGIGSALVAEFLQADYSVIALDRTPHVMKPHPNLHSLDFDLQNMSLPDNTIGQLFSKQIPNLRVDTLINNAAHQYIGTVASLPVIEWQKSLDINLTAPFLLTQYFLDSLKTVINITSVHAQATKKGFSAYAASKAGLQGLTRALAVELGPEIRVVAIAPAAIATPMLEDSFKDNLSSRQQLDACHPVGRIGYPQEVAKLALYLASDAAAFISGQTMVIDGGVLSRLYDPA